MTLEDKDKQIPKQTDSKLYTAVWFVPGKGNNVYGIESHKREAMFCLKKFKFCFEVLKIEYLNNCLLEFRVCFKCFRLYRASWVIAGDCWFSSSYLRTFKDL